MELLHRMAGLAAAVLCLANPAFAQDKSKTAATASASEAAVAKVLENAMTPGAGQKRLEPMIGNFDVAIRIWVDPSKPPLESSGTMVSSWVLGNRYVQSMLAGSAGGEPFNGIGYISFDNVTKTYQATWMDSGSTGMTWYSGGFDASGKSATMTASVPSVLTGKFSPLELRMTISDDGGHVSELWGEGLGSTMFKMMELRYTRSK